MWQQANAIAYLIPKHNQGQDTSVCLYHLPVETRNTVIHGQLYIYICKYCILYTYIYICTYQSMPTLRDLYSYSVLTPRALHIASVWLVPPEHLAKTETKTIVNLVDGVYNCNYMVYIIVSNCIWQKNTLLDSTIVTLKKIEVCSIVSLIFIPYFQLLNLSILGDWCDWNMIWLWLTVCHGIDGP